MTPPVVKICGITDATSAAVASESGAAYLGFVSFPKSPRHLTLEAAKALGPQLPEGPARVGVFVNATAGHIALYKSALSLTHAQLHGHETPEDCRLIKAMTGLKLIKALSVSEKADLAKVTAYGDVVDMLLFDAKPPIGAPLPGGNNVSLPWHLLKGADMPHPWFLAGGLNSQNIQTAISESGARYLDISSGVESAPGVKDAALIKKLMQGAQSL